MCQPLFDLCLLFHVTSFRLENRLKLLAFIQSLQKGRKITPINPKSPLHKNSFTLKLTKKGLSVRIVATKTHPFAVEIGDQKHSYIANIRPKPIVLKDIFLSSQKSKLSTGSIHELHTKGYSKKRAYYYRPIIPLEKELALHYILEERPFSTDLGYRSRTGHQVIAGGETFTICFLHDDIKQYYLSIESGQKQSADSFSEKSFSIQCALAFVSGQFPGGVSFFFANRKANKKAHDQIRMIETRKPIRTLYQPVYTNPYAIPPTHAIRYP